MVKYTLCNRRPENGMPVRGISCDEDGVFIAGDVPLVTSCPNSEGERVYRCRSTREINFLVSNAFGPDADFSDRGAQLNLVARYMNEGKWVLAKIAAVHLRVPELSDDRALKRLVRADAELKRIYRSSCQAGCSELHRGRASKRDVSQESRIPAGQPGGGEWESQDSRSTPIPKAPLVPVQAVPMPLPLPFEFPVPPSEFTPLPFVIPNGNIREPIPANPYPDRPDCVEEWADAYRFCRSQQQQGKLKPGYGGFGKDFGRCVMGMVSEACGGNATGA